MKGVEESNVEKILVDLGFLLFTNLMVFVKTCKVFNRHYDRMDVGGLAGCTFMFSQMLFVSFWYMLNIEVRRSELLGSVAMLAHKFVLTTICKSYCCTQIGQRRRTTEQ